MPACERVNDRNTPTAYSGMRAWVSPPNSHSSAPATSANSRIPFENTRRSPRFASWRGK